MFTYVAYPLDRMPSASAIGVYADITAILNDLRKDAVISTTYDPGEAFTVSAMTEPNPQIATVNWAAFDAADLVIAFLPREIHSVGVPIEIDRAAMSGKKVVIVADRPVSFMLRYNRPNVLLIERGQVGPTNEEAAAQIRTWIRANHDLPGSAELAPLPFTVEEGARLPAPGYPGDAGFDLYVAEKATFLPGEFRDVPCGVAVELPPGVWGMITGRSSTVRTRGLLVTQGIIDTGYRGPLFAGTHNLSAYEEVTVEEGERIAQLILFPNLADVFSPMKVTELNASPRGTNGFGSSGQ